MVCGEENVIMVMPQEIEQGFAFSNDDESVEILELGAICKSVEVNGLNTLLYFFDGMWFIQDMTE